MATLYAIRDDLEALAALLYEVGGDVSEDEAAAAIDGWLRETDEALRSKLDRYAALIRETESAASTRRAEADRLDALAKADEETVKRLKARLQWFLEDQELDRYETSRFKITLAVNGGHLPVRVSLPPEHLPQQFQRVTVAADIDAIRTALQQGPLDFAEFGERGHHLRIR